MRYKELLKSVFEITQKHREFNTSSFFRLGSFKFSKFETGYYISSSTVWKPFDFPSDLSNPVTFLPLFSEST